MGSATRSVTVAALSDIGPRAVQQDRAITHLHDDGSWVLAVFDGLGGHARGEDAAQAAADAFSDRIDGAEEMSAAVAAANSAVWELIPDRRATVAGPSPSDPLTTVAAASWTPGSGLSVAWVGDSVLFFVPILGDVPGMHTEPQGSWDSPIMDNALGWGPVVVPSRVGRLEQETVDWANEHIDNAGLIVVAATDGLFDPIRHSRYGRTGRFADAPSDNSIGFAIQTQARSNASASASALMSAAKHHGLSDNAAVAVSLACRESAPPRAAA